MRDTKIVLFNGPPGSGKDALASGIQARNGGVVSLEKFANPIKAACRAFYNLSEYDWAMIDNDQELKNRALPEFNGISCRQAQINMSELFAKPTHNKHIFGELCATRILHTTGYVFFITDSGFKEEAQSLINEFGTSNVTHVKLHRKGKTFEGDSRSYIELPSEIDTITLHNNVPLHISILGLETQLKAKGILQ